MLILAHRGASRQAPENTVDAFVRARELGADGIELDVHRTADGELVVHHDATLPDVGLVSHVMFADLRAALPSVPTLTEALDAASGMRLVNVEMKCCAWDADADPDRIVARGVAAELERRAAYDRYVVSSFDLAMVDDLRAHDPRITTAWLFHGSDPRPAVGIAAAGGHRWLHPDWGNLAAVLDDAVATAHGEGLQLDPWTVDDPDVMLRMARAGVDALITNVPDVALATVRN